MERIHALQRRRSIGRSTPKMRVNAIVRRRARLHDQLRGVNLNAPVRRRAARSRRSPTSSRSSRTRRWQHYDSWCRDLNVNFAGGVRNAGAARWNPRRTTFGFNYRHRARRTTTSTARSSCRRAARSTISGGRAGGDTRHRCADRRCRLAGAEEPQRASDAGLRNSGSPYTITTGFDDNGDSIFNDRPAGVGAQQRAHAVAGQR